MPFLHQIRERLVTPAMLTGRDLSTLRTTPAVARASDTLESSSARGRRVSSAALLGRESRVEAAHRALRAELNKIFKRLATIVRACDLVEGTRLSYKQGGAGRVIELFAPTATRARAQQGVLADVKETLGRIGYEDVRLKLTAARSPASARLR